MNQSISSYSFLFTILYMHLADICRHLDLFLYNQLITILLCFEDMFRHLKPCSLKVVTHLSFGLSVESDVLERHWCCRQPLVCTANRFAWFSNLIVAQLHVNSTRLWVCHDLGSQNVFALTMFHIHILLYFFFSFFCGGVQAVTWCKRDLSFTHLETFSFLRPWNEQWLKFEPLCRSFS